MDFIPLLLLNHNFFSLFPLLVSRSNEIKPSVINEILNRPMRSGNAEVREIFRLVGNSETWALESGIQLKEFAIPLAIGIQNPSSTDCKESGIQYLESEIHSVKARIQRLSWITLLSLHGAKLNLNIVIK